MGMATGKWRRMRPSPAVKKTVAALLALLFVFSVTGFFILPPVLKSYLTKKLSTQLHREVSIRQIKVNPFMLSVTVKGFNVRERNGKETFFSFDKLYVNLQSSSILKRALVIRELRLVGPYLNIRRNPDLRYNFSDLLKKGHKKPASAPMRFSVNNIQILNGSADFLDNLKHVLHTVRGLNLTIPFISDMPYYTDTFVQPSFEAMVNNEWVSFKGKTKPFAKSLETSVDLRVKDLDLTHYLAYFPFKMDFGVPSGHLDVNTHVTYVQYKDRAPSLGLSGDIALKKLKVVDRSGRPVADFPMIGVSVTSSDLFSEKAHLSKLVLLSPKVDVVRGRGGRMNIMALLPQKKKGGTPGTKEKKAPLIQADEMTIRDGKLVFTDRVAGKEFRTRIDPLQVKVSHFTTAPGEKSAVELSLETEAHESLRASGDFSVMPFSADGEIKLKQVLLKKYAPYYRKMVRFDITDGKLGVATRFSYAGSKESPAARLSDMSISLDRLRLKKRGEKKDFLNMPVVAVKGADVDLLKRTLAAGEIKTEKGTVVVERRKDGTLNLEGLLAGLPKGHAKTESRNKGGTPVSVKSPAWLITLKKVSVDGLGVKMKDSAAPSPVSYSVDRIRLKGRNISTAKGSRGSVWLSCRLGGRGSLTARGIVGIVPVALRARLDLRGVDIIPFQPYFTNRVKILVTGGAVSTDGTLGLRYFRGAVAASYKGAASLLHFSSLDKAKGDEFLKWDSLHLGAMSVSYSPLSVHIGQVALSDFYSRLIIEQDGSINLRGIFLKRGSAGSSDSQQQGRGVVGKYGNTPGLKMARNTPGQKMVRIDAVTLQGGTINFSDRHIQPNYSANLLEIGGRISGLSSAENTAADVDLRGKLDNYAPLEITGKINPLRKDLYVDLRADFRDMDMSSLTPYSGRHIGYTIRKGKLFLSLEYLIVKKKLEAQNRIFLDQLTLGKKVESPKATKLPVRLAIALLKDRNGEINLDVPVTGYINDPKFSLGRIILKILVNILVKAATSPFTLLSNLFGGGADLSHVEFGAGTAAISGDQAKKLDAVEKALYSRPSLKLEIEGYADPEKDREGLRQYIFDRKVEFQKWKDIAAKGGQTIPVGEVKVGKDEYPKYLKKAYKAEKFPKPRNIFGFAKSLPVPEMEKLMLTNIRVKDSDLRALASRRALAVKDYILKSGKVDPKRIFLVEAKSLSPGKKQKLSDSRVDLKLK